MITIKDYSGKEPRKMIQSETAMVICSTICDDFLRRAML